MKAKLRQIYDDLARGRIAKQEALDRIKAIKRREQDAGVGAALAVPAWESSRISVARDGAAPIDSAAVVIRQQHIVSCELPADTARELPELVSHSQCLTLQSAGNGAAERYAHYAGACFRLIQDLLKEKPASKTLIQVVVTDAAEHLPLTGLAALLATMTLENPDLLGQLIIVESRATAGELAILLQENQAKIGRAHV